MEPGPFGKAFMATNGVIFAILVVLVGTKLLYGGVEWARRVDPHEAWLALRSFPWGSLAWTLGPIATVVIVLTSAMRWRKRRYYC